MSLIVSLLVVCLILAIAWWAINQLTLPPPVRMVVVVIIVFVWIIDGWVANPTVKALFTKCRTRGSNHEPW